jgi:hypothetical protein
MKTYTTPVLAPVGSVVALTQGAYMGSSDPGALDAKSPIGSVGFGL